MEVNSFHVSPYRKDSLFQGTPRKQHQIRNSDHSPLLLSTSAHTDYEIPKLKSALVKPSKTLTVSLEYDSSENDETLTDMDLTTLSMQLRKSKVASLWTSDVTAISIFAKEQESAKGSFPGPCPVVFVDTKEGDLDAAMEHGVDAIVLNDDEIPKSSDIVKKYPTIEIIWRIATKESASQIMDAGYGHAFLLPPPTKEDSSEESIHEILKILPKKAAKILPVGAMQEKSSEIDTGRYYKKLGVNSILVQTAIVGDSEDIAYASHVVDGFTSKKSSEFQMTGLTGSANGHFGGVEAKGDTKWRRQEMKME